MSAAFLARLVGVLGRMGGAALDLLGDLFGDLLDDELGVVADVLTRRFVESGGRVGASGDYRLPLVQCTAKVVVLCTNNRYSHTNSPETEPRLSVVSPAAAAGAGVHAHDLGKRYGDLWALRELDLDVAARHRSRPPRSQRRGQDHRDPHPHHPDRADRPVPRPSTVSMSCADPGGVRRRIGVANQQATVDGLMSARANLVMVGRLHHVPKERAEPRADELLERFDLTDARRLAKNLSGGMRRRLDLAASLVASPQVLFLDEPTTGLDPRSRGELWDMLRDLVRDGTTIILTTQYLEEADRMADDIVVLDHGRTVAHGTPDELKTQFGNERIDVTVASVGAFDSVVHATQIARVRARAVRPRLARRAGSGSGRRTSTRRDARARHGRGRCD